MASSSPSAWRLSLFLGLGATFHGSVVQRCLEELERRDPAGFQAWLATTASAGGDPSRYVPGTSSDRPPHEYTT